MKWKKKLKKSIYKSSWINCLQEQNYIRSKALFEIKSYVGKMKENNEDEETEMTHGKKEMLKFFEKLLKVMNPTENLTNGEKNFQKFVKKEIIHDSTKDEHLPIPVYSYLKPTLGVQFIHHILISMGKFHTEIDLTTRGSIRDSLRYAKLIGNSNREDDLKKIFQ